mgnify:CR=1 FL=1
MPTHKGEHSCKCTELSPKRKEGIELFGGLIEFQSPTITQNHLNLWYRGKYWMRKLKHIFIYITLKQSQLNKQRDIWTHNERFLFT